MLLNDKQIIELGNSGHITPFHDAQIKTFHNTVSGLNEKIVSYGTSSFGYDVTLASEIVFFIPNSGIFDIHNPESAPETRSEYVSEFILNPGEMVLGKTYEYIKMPRNCLAICVGKSTWARQGLIVNVTPIEPQWAGHITLELSNISNNPIKVYCFEGITQLLFLSGEEPRTSYADKNGKYQNQERVTLAKL